MCRSISCNPLYPNNHQATPLTARLTLPKTGGTLYSGNHHKRSNSSTMGDTTQRDILATIALPYANGPIHLGHLIEAIQADIWVRFQHMRGHHCLYICGSDAHGTAIMLSAEKQQTSPEEVIAKINQQHQQTFSNFLINFDNFYTTHSPENQALCNEFYNTLLARGDITTRTISQAFDPEKELFLADRFIKGECPRCGADDQYGDNCEACGATYSPAELKNARSMLSGATPTMKESEHVFFQLENHRDTLEAWVNDEHLQPQVANKLREWFNEPLRDWDISRDAPYFGFEIPGAPGKYFYVWMDAPVGYLASLKHLAEQRDDINYDNYWNPDSKAEVYHFIGKDIVYFHALFWPAMLHGAGLRLPTEIIAHGFLTVNGQKMSKSRGTFITGDHYLTQLDPQFLRYYTAAKLSSQVEDIDLSGEDFMLRNNSDLVGKYINLASRNAGFITKKFDGLLADQLHNPELYQRFLDASETIADHYEQRNYNRCMREIMQLADLANQYIDQHQPWALAKEEGKEAEVQAICTQGLNLFRVLTTYLKPILPDIASAVESFS